MLALLPLIGPVLERLAALIPDPAARAQAVAQAQTEVMDALSSSDANQIEVNKIEAASGNFFVAGWRPMIGWVCGAALFMEFLIRPVLSWSAPDMPPMPQAGEGLWVVVTGILGIGALRSIEKIQGTRSPEPSGLVGGARR